MKYSIFGYEQKELANYNIDCADLVLLDYLIYKCLNSTLEYKVIDDNRYIWITHAMIVDDLPFLKLKERGIENRINNLTSIGFIDRKKKQDNNGTLKSYLRITDLVNQLKFADGNTNQLAFKFEQETKIEEKQIYPYQEIVDYLNEKAKTNYKHSTKSTRTLIGARFRDGFKLEDFKKVIDTKTKEWLNTPSDKYLRPETLFGNKFESYLNQKEIKPNRQNIDRSTPYGWEAEDTGIKFKTLGEK